MIVSSLRFKLIGSYVAIIFICLSLAASAVVILLRDYQERIRLDQLADLSFGYSFFVRSMEEGGATPAQIALYLHRQSEMLRVRIILATREGLVLDDTAGDLSGTYVHLPWADGTERRPNSSRAYYAVNEDGIFMIAPALRAFGERRASGTSSSYVVILAVPQATVAQAWWELAPSLSGAAVVSLIVSILVALFLTRSISRPLLEMTRASEEMSRGRYEQSIDVRGRDEVARLAKAFNAMARQVSSSDRTMRDFLANVSHELKTPLTSIQGFSQAMLDGTIHGAEHYRNAATIINDESQAMRRLVDELLTLSKIESGQISMDHDPVEVDRVVREALRRADWHTAGAEPRVVTALESSARVRGDAHWLGQVFSNLIENAITHTPPDGSIAVRSTADTGQGVVTIEVQNTGSFIPADDLPRVFERFFQVDRSRSGRAHGSGLGLAIVREVVQAHGGSVAAESDSATGTTFTVRLPLDSIVETTPLAPFRRVA